MMKKYVPARTVMRYYILFTISMRFFKNCLFLLLKVFIIEASYISIEVKVTVHGWVKLNFFFLLYCCAENAVKAAYVLLPRFIKICLTLPFLAPPPKKKNKNKLKPLYLDKYPHWSLASSLLDKINRAFSYDEWPESLRIKTKF